MEKEKLLQSLVHSLPSKTCRLNQPLALMSAQRLLAESGSLA